MITAPRPWLGISPRDWFINSDTPHSWECRGCRQAARMYRRGSEAGSTGIGCERGDEVVSVTGGPPPVRPRWPSVLMS